MQSQVAVDTCRRVTMGGSVRVCLGLESICHGAHSLRTHLQKLVAWLSPSPLEQHRANNPAQA